MSALKVADFLLKRLLCLLPLLYLENTQARFHGKPTFQLEDSFLLSAIKNMYSLKTCLNSEKVSSHWSLFKLIVQTVLLVSICRSSRYFSLMPKDGEVTGRNALVFIVFTLCELIVAQSL